MVMKKKAVLAGIVAAVLMAAFTMGCQNAQVSDSQMANESQDEAEEVASKEDGLAETETDIVSVAADIDDLKTADDFFLLTDESQVVAVKGRETKVVYKSTSDNQYIDVCETGTGNGCYFAVGGYAADLSGVATAGEWAMSEEGTLKNAIAVYYVDRENLESHKALYLENYTSPEVTIDQGAIYISAYDTKDDNYQNVLMVCSLTDETSLRVEYNETFTYEEAEESSYFKTSHRYALKNEYIPDKEDAIVAAEDWTYLYYYVSDTPIGGRNSYYKVYRRNLDTGQDVFLYDSSDVPGVPIFNLGVSGMRIHDNNLYFLDVDSQGVEVGWYYLDLADLSKGKQLLTPLYVYDTNRLGTIETDYTEFSCVDCEKIARVFETEKYQVTDDDIFAKDYINEQLEEYYVDYINRISNDLDVEPDYVHDEYYTPYYENLEVDEAYRRGNYLMVNYNEYSYTGGAHGMPSKKFMIFNVYTGDRCEFKDLYQGTEEDFKELVAQKALEDYRSGTKGYYEEESGAIFAKKVRDYVSLQDAFIKLGKRYATYYFYPYEMGPYASGFITVDIRYDELNMDFFY